MKKLIILLSLGINVNCFAQTLNQPICASIYDSCLFIGVQNNYCVSKVNYSCTSAVQMNIQLDKEKTTCSNLANPNTGDMWESSQYAVYSSRTGAWFYINPNIGNAYPVNMDGCQIYLKINDILFESITDGNMYNPIVQHSGYMVLGISQSAPKAYSFPNPIISSCYSSESNLPCGINNPVSAQQDPYGNIVNYTYKGF